MNALRRGACPGLSDPMPTGDGLLARLITVEPLPLDILDALCAACSEYGNGIIEVTQRGSLQIRGLTAASSPLFAERVDALGLAALGSLPVLTAPLLGIDTGEPMDLRGLTDELKRRWLRRPDIVVGAKVSVSIDGGGTLHLQEFAADVRLQAITNSLLHVSIGGTGATATSVGHVPLTSAADAVIEILACIASRGSEARARDLSADVQPLRAALAGSLVQGANALEGSRRPLETQRSLEGSPRPPGARLSSGGSPQSPWSSATQPAQTPCIPYEPIGVHTLSSGRVARGVALAFGYTHADTLRQFAQAAARCGATSIRPAPGRALLAIGLTADAADELTASAAAAGFVVSADDPRRRVIACAGAPACASATIATRQLAIAAAETARDLLDRSITIHLSGCTKGCAHAAPAALTFVGPDRLVVHGRAGDAPHGTISTTAFITGLQRLQDRRQSLAADECSEDLLSQFGTPRVLEALGARPAHG